MSIYRTKVWWGFQIVEVLALIGVWSIANPKGWKWLVFMLSSIILVSTNYLEGRWAERHHP